MSIKPWMSAKFLQLEFSWGFVLPARLARRTCLDQLGNCLSRTPSLRSMDGDTTRLAYKQVRLHGGCVVSESERRITLSPPVQAGEDNSSLVSEQISVDPSGSCLRAFELRNGFVLRTEPGARGMEVAPPNGQCGATHPWFADLVNL